MSGLYKERGKVIGVNSEATKLFKYSRSEMVNNPIENLMPKFYSKHHKDFMARFLRQGTSRILGYRRRVFILNKKNFIKGADLYVKIMSSLDDGMHIVGFLNSYEEDNEEDNIYTKRRKVKYLLTYEKNSGELQYVCENTYRYLGMKSNTSNRMSVFLEKNNMKIICPSLFEKMNEKSTHIGLKVIFDTSHLVESNRSLLKELEDDVSALGVNLKKAKEDFEAQNEEEKDNMDVVTNKMHNHLNPFISHNSLEVPKSNDSVDKK